MAGWIVLAVLGGIALTSLVVMGIGMTRAEVGVDPFAGLPTFDDDEAATLLENGA